MREPSCLSQGACSRRESVAGARVAAEESRALSPHLITEIFLDEESQLPAPSQPAQGHRPPRARQNFYSHSAFAENISARASATALPHALLATCDSVQGGGDHQLLLASKESNPACTRESHGGAGLLATVQWASRRQGAPRMRRKTAGQAPHSLLGKEKSGTTL